MGRAGEDGSKRREGDLSEKGGQVKEHPSQPMLRAQHKPVGPMLITA